MLIRVEQKHIDNAVANDCYYCAVALAVKEITKEEFVIIVGANDVAILSKQGEQIDCVEMPEIAKYAIYVFDVHKIMYPFNFELPINKYCK